MFLLSLLACDPEFTWFQTCGDPACQGYTGPFDGVPPCATEAIGETCPDEGATCDPEEACNALLVCASEDPTDQTGGCPISRASFKRDIRYPSKDDIARLAQTALAIPLAWWSYRGEPGDADPHFGFVIDDIGRGPAVTPDGDHVDLYGYTSLVLAAVQTQHRQIEGLEARLAAQEQQVAVLQARLDALDVPVGRTASPSSSLECQGTVTVAVAPDDVLSTVHVPLGTSTRE